MSPRFGHVTAADRRPVVRVGPLIRLTRVVRVLTPSCGHPRRVTGREARTPPKTIYCQTCAHIAHVGGR